MTEIHLFPDTEKGIILAADVDTLEDLRKLVKLSIGVPEVCAIKVGFTLVSWYGMPTVVNTIAEIADLPVIYDHQKAGTDIPQMGARFATYCSKAGMRGLILFPHSGPRTLASYVAAAFDQGIVPIVGLVMTHEAYLESEGGYITDHAPEAICELSIELGVRTFVLPGTKIDIISHFVKGQLSSIVPTTIMMPGIGKQGGSIAGAFEAAKGHRTFAIIGSSIYGADDPKMALELMTKEVK